MRHFSNWLWPRGIQARFFPVLALFLVGSMTFLGLSLFLTQRQITRERIAHDRDHLTQELNDKGNAYSVFLSHIAPQGILAHDYPLLEGYVEELSADPDIAYAVIFNRAQRPLTHFLKPIDSDSDAAPGGTVQPNLFADVLERIRRDPAILVVRRDIQHNGTRLGSVEVGLSSARVGHRVAERIANQDRELIRIALITGSEILLSLIVLILLIQWAFSRQVVKPIQALGEDMARVRSGDFNVRVEITRDDEIGWLAAHFNTMAADLRSHLQEIDAQRNTYKETCDYLVNILDNSADMIATTALDGSVVEFNTAAERILGYRREEIVGQSSGLLYCDPAERDRLFEIARRGESLANTDIRLLRRDGSVIDVELTLSPLRNNAGEVIGTICIGRDVTHAKAMRQQLIQAEKMASVGQVAAWITHQIRNSLGSILMATLDLIPAGQVSPSASNAHRELTTSIKKLDRMVTDLLEYSRTLTLHPISMNLNAALNDLLNALAGDIRDRGIRIDRVLAPELPAIRMDVFKVEQALGNILRNAVQAMPEGGTLRVQTRCGPGDRQVTVIVEDSGVGICAEDIPKVFLPFFTTKTGGTGLGLAMALRIVEAHGGRIGVTSSAGHGTTFTITLPDQAAGVQAA